MPKPPAPEKLKATTFFGSLKEIFAGVMKPLILVWLVIMLRSFTQLTISTYVPMMADSLGYSLVSIGVIISVYTAAGSISGMGAGVLADRIGFKKVVVTTLALGTPCPAALHPFAGQLDLPGQHPGPGPCSWLPCRSPWPWPRI